MGRIPLIIMIVAGIGMVIGLAKQKAGTEWGKPVAIACIIVALAAALWSMFSTRNGQGTAGVVDREIAFQKVSGKKLGLYLAEKYAGQKVLILTEPTVGSQTGTAAALVAGLKEGMGSKLTIAAEASPEVPAEKAKAFARDMPMEGGAGAAASGGMLPPLDYWYTAKIFDSLLGKYEGQFDLLVTAIGLPQDARASAVLKGKSCPKIAVLSGSIYELKGSIKPTLIVAAVTYKPKPVFDEKPVPRDLDEAFDKRFLLVTPDTLQQVASANPEIFRSGN